MECGWLSSDIKGEHFADQVTGAAGISPVVGTSTPECNAIPERYVEGARILRLWTFFPPPSFKGRRLSRRISS
jgi:hypothetical protein